jgi:uncharacterized membrane protein affecting hemolysin expression
MYLILVILVILCAVFMRKKRDKYEETYTKIIENEKVSREKVQDMR